MEEPTKEVPLIGFVPENLTGAANLKSPIGGIANGIPKNISDSNPSVVL